MTLLLIGDDMFLDKNSIQVNGTSFGQYLVSAKYEYNKLWASDTGRNLAGVNTGTLIGIFPKIIMQFRKLTKTELETIASILDSPTQSVRYYDPNKQNYITIDTYTSDWGFENNGIINNYRKNEGFNISFIARRKR